MKPTVPTVSVTSSDSSERPLVSFVTPFDDPTSSAMPMSMWAEKEKEKEKKPRKLVSSMFRSCFPIFPTANPAACGRFTHERPSLGSSVIGTLYGYRKGHVYFSVHDDSRSTIAPALLLELAMPTGALVKEMASGLVRIALECEKATVSKLFHEPVWSMCCNGRKTGYALRRLPSVDIDLRVLSLLRAVSMGAGVLPMVAPSLEKESPVGGELMYMRAKFERVVGSRDSEALYMMNLDGSGGPELSIFFLRI